MARQDSWLANPAIREYDGPVERSEGTFSVAGTAVKTLFLLAILACTFGYAWNISTQGYAEAFSTQTAEGKLPDSIPISPTAVPLILVGCFGGFAVAMLTIFVQRLAPFTSPFYAALEGLALGGISAAFEAKHPGIVLEAVGSTVGVFFGMLVLFLTGIVRPTARFHAMLLAALFGILALYLVDNIMLFFGSYITVVHSNGPWGIVLQVFIVGVASFCLISDFGQISDAAESRAPKWYEWYAGFSLLVTLVWLYLEILKLYGKSKSSD